MPQQLEGSTSIGNLFPGTPSPKARSSKLCQQSKISISRPLNSAISFHRTLTESTLNSIMGLAQTLRTSWYFQNFVHCTIVCSAVQMGIQAEFRDAESWPGWLFFENAFTFIFAVEMVLWLVALRLKYFKQMWNVLDFIIAWVSIVSSWVLPALEIGTDNNIGVVKIFRLLRLFRVLRIMKVVPELRMVIEGIAASIGALFWICMMLALTIYAFSIFCVEIVGTASDVYPGYDASDERIRETLAMRSFNNFEYFGDLRRSMMSLFSIVILAEWDAIRPIWEYQRECIPVFVLLVFVTSFGVVNVIIGVIVERTNESMQKLKDSEQELRRMEQMRMIQSLADYVWMADADGNGNISRQEMRRIASNPEILVKVCVMDFPKGFTFDDMFMMLNIDGKGELTKDEFISGMHRIIFSDDFQTKCLTHLGLGQIKDLHTSLIEQQEQRLQRMFATVRNDIEQSANLVIREVLAATCPVETVEDTKETCHKASRHLSRSRCRGSGTKSANATHSPAVATDALASIAHAIPLTKFQSGPEKMTIASPEAASPGVEGGAGISTEPCAISDSDCESAPEEVFEKGSLRCQPSFGVGGGAGERACGSLEPPVVEIADVQLAEVPAAEPTLWHSALGQCCGRPSASATGTEQLSPRPPESVDQLV